MLATFEGWRIGRRERRANLRVHTVNVRFGGDSHTTRIQGLFVGSTPRRALRGCRSVPDGGPHAPQRVRTRSREGDGARGGDGRRGTTSSSWSTTRP
jgi:hypothetical protein